MALHVRTPLIESTPLSARTGKRVLLKMENLQPDHDPEQVTVPDTPRNDRSTHDPTHPLYGIYGDNPRDTASVENGKKLVSGIVEARGCERFGMVAEALADPALQGFYREIAASEACHDALFLDLASVYFPQPSIDSRLDAEAKILQGLAIRPALH